MNSQDFLPVQESLDVGFFKKLLQVNNSYLIFIVFTQQGSLARLKKSPMLEGTQLRLPMTITHRLPTPVILAISRQVVI